MRRTLPVFFFLVALSFVSPGAAVFAEESLTALSPDAVRERLGPPDRREASGTKERWHYGNSIVFFDAGHVTAWSDSGDLNNHQVVAQMAQKPKRGPGEVEPVDGWLNAWKREKRVTTEDVIDELMGTSPASGF